MCSGFRHMLEITDVDNTRSLKKFEALLNGLVFYWRISHGFLDFSHEIGAFPPLNPSIELPYFTGLV